MRVWFGKKLFICKCLILWTSILSKKVIVNWLYYHHFYFFRTIQTYYRSVCIFYLLHKIINPIMSPSRQPTHYCFQEPLECPDLQNMLHSDSSEWDNFLYSQMWKMEDIWPHYSRIPLLLIFFLSFWLSDVEFMRGSALRRPPFNFQSLPHHYQSSLM